MKAVVTDGSTVVYGDKTYEEGQKVEIPEVDAQALIEAGHIVDEKTHKEILKAKKEQEKREAEEAAAEEDQEAEK